MQQEELEMGKIYSFFKKFLYSVVIFIFFPLAWANHFRLLPGHELLHCVGFFILIILSLYMLKKLSEDKKINDDFAEKVNEAYLVVLVVNVIIYIAAWIYCGGPGFVFLDSYGSGWAKVGLLLFYVVWMIFFLLSPSDEHIPK